MLSTFTPTIYKRWVIISVNIGFIPMGCILLQACCECDYFISTFNDNFQCMGNDSCCIFIHLTGDRKNRHWTSNLFLHNKFCFTINDQNQIPYVVCLPRLTIMILFQITITITYVNGKLIFLSYAFGLEPMVFWA